MSAVCWNRLKVEPQKRLIFEESENLLLATARNEIEYRADHADEYVISVPFLVPNDTMKIRVNM